MKKVALIILDGFGITPEKRGNAVLIARTPNLDLLIPRFPKCLLKASSEEVGLPWGETGNSEVGHTNIGLGRVVLQDLPQIDAAIENNLLDKKEGIIKAKDSLKKTPGNVNIIFLASDGAVHGHIRHLEPMIKIFENSSAQKIVLHIISDGRDAPEKSLQTYLAQIKPLLSDKVIIGSLSGRYFAMDRDKNYDRTQLAYSAILGQSDNIFSGNTDQAIESAYQKNETDEFITPVSLAQNPKANLQNDIFIFTNYRTDRSLQLTRAFVDAKFQDFKREGTCKNFITMTTYDDNLPVSILFSNLELYDKNTNSISNPLSKLIADQDLKQFHIAETEKYAHVTRFFSGTDEEFKNQQNKLIPSDKVKSYDLKPQMKAKEISDEVILQAEKGTEFIVANIANGDMVGHSGDLEAAIVAVEFIDYTIGRITGNLLKNNYTVFITADHGNCDQMIDLASGKRDKEHSLNPAPFIHISNENKGTFQSKDEFFSSEPIGILADIAPTITFALGINPSKEITGMNLTESLK